MSQEAELEDGSDSEASAHGKDEDEHMEEDESKPKKAKAPAKKAVLKFSLGGKTKAAKAEKVSCVVGTACDGLHGIAWRCIGLFQSYAGWPASTAVHLASAAEAQCNAQCHSVLMTLSASIVLVITLAQLQPLRVFRWRAWAWVRLLRRQRWATSTRSAWRPGRPASLYRFLSSSTHLTCASFRRLHIRP